MLLAVCSILLHFAGKHQLQLTFSVLLKVPNVGRSWLKECADYGTLKSPVENIHRWYAESITVDKGV